MEKPDRKRKTFSLKLTRFELIHLRDLLSIKMAPDLEQTISQALAAVEERPVIEAHLWRQVIAACKEAKLPLGDSAPDFVCAAEPVVARPPVGIYRIAEEPVEETESGLSASDNNPFIVAGDSE
jgi:hypothetical protein